MDDSQLNKLDALKDRMLKEYTMNGDTDEYKKIMKRVVEIGTRMIHSTLTDISDVPMIKAGFERILEKFESFEIIIKSLEQKVGTMNHISMQPNCMLVVEKMIYEIVKSEADRSKKNVGFIFEILRFILYVIPIVGTLIWATLHSKGTL